MDQKIIDGFLHLVARVTYWLGTTFREKFDLPVINHLIGDGTAAVTQWFGEQARKLQTGKVQQYMIIAVLLASFGLFYYLIALQP
jgi:NADH:ubiquinone oxidoreductase subunit 5 (subunit L)/multisubunit Na+/H+ antiporter MnhA subunit